jgi:alkylation response protein AidB-like acyl-CoA dehydrogenase
MPNSATHAVPTVDDLLAGLDEIAPQLAADPDADEDARQISRKAYDLLEAGGYTSMLAASEFGGLDLGPLDGLRVIERLSEIDVAAGWTTMIFNSHLKDLHFLDRGAAEKLYAAGPPKIAGQGAPTGKAEKVEGGYRITGRWSYGSALPFADFVATAAMITENGKPVMLPSGAPDVILFVTPKKNVSDDGNWDVLGLRATASNDYSMTDVFVPQEMTRPNLFQAGFQWGGRSALLTMPGWLMWDHTSVELGLGRRLLDELAAYACQASIRRGRLAESPVFSSEFAQAEAAFRSAHAWVYRVWEDVQATVDADRPLSRAQLTDTRAALLHIHDVNERNASFVFRQAGGASLRPGTLQRLCRDAMAAGQHLLLSTSSYIDCGRDYLGEAEGQQWSFYALS